MATDMAQPLSFSDFLEKMKDPAAADLVRHIKSFIKHFEDRPRNHPADPDADGAKVQEFMARSEQLFRAHPVWRGSLPAVLDQAVEGLEKYVMSKVWRETFGGGQEERDRDERYTRLMRALVFVDLPTLMGVEGVVPDPALLAMAQGELLKMDKYKAPRDKLLCLVNVKTMVESIVQDVAKRGARVGGADAFFPVFLFVVIRSCLPRLAGNVEYIKRFRMASRLTGQFDFMLCNLESVAMYLDTVNYEHLHISQDDFLARLAAAGIPEADIELRRRQRQQLEEEAQVQAAGGAAAAATSPPRHGPASPRAAEACLRQQEQQQQQHDARGGQLGSDGPLQLQGSGEEGQEELGGAGLSLPQTPAGPPRDFTALAATAQASPGQTPLGGGGTGGREDAAAAAAAAAAPAPGLSPPPRPAPGGGEDAAAAALLAAQGAAGSGTFLGRQLWFEKAGPAAPATAPAPAAAQASRPPSAEGEWEAGVIVDEMVAEGARYVLEAEARGQLQRKYPYMYASPDDLTMADVRRVLAGYKALILRYESLAVMLRRQLGDTAAGEPSASSAAALAGLQVPAAATAGGPGGSPTRRSLLQRITSRTGRGGGGRADTSSDAAVADDGLHRMSPVAVQAPMQQAKAGPAALLSSLFGSSPQRQAGRSREGAVPSAAGSVPAAITMQPLPASTQPGGAAPAPAAAASTPTAVNGRDGNTALPVQPLAADNDAEGQAASEVGREGMPAGEQGAQIQSALDVQPGAHPSGVAHAAIEAELLLAAPPEPEPTLAATTQPQASEEGDAGPDSQPQQPAPADEASESLSALEDDAAEEEQQEQQQQQPSRPAGAKQSEGDGASEGAAALEPASAEEAQELQTGDRAGLPSAAPDDDFGLLEVTGEEGADISLPGSQTASLPAPPPADTALFGDLQLLGEAGAAGMGNTPEPEGMQRPQQGWPAGESLI